MTVKPRRNRFTLKELRYYMNEKKKLPMSEAYISRFVQSGAIKASKEYGRHYLTFEELKKAIKLLEETYTWAMQKKQSKGDKTA